MQIEFLDHQMLFQFLELVFTTSTRFPKRNYAHIRTAEAHFFLNFPPWVWLCPIIRPTDQLILEKRYLLAYTLGNLVVVQYWLLYLCKVDKFLEGVSSVSNYLVDLDLLMICLSVMLASLPFISWWFQCSLLRLLSKCLCLLSLQFNCNTNPTLNSCTSQTMHLDYGGPNVVWFRDIFYYPKEIAYFWAHLET